MQLAVIGASCSVMPVGALLLVLHFAVLYQGMHSQVAATPDRVCTMFGVLPTSWQWLCVYCDLRTQAASYCEITKTFPVFSQNMENLLCRKK